jgi:uncharacterized protein
MAKPTLMVDTSGFYALLVKGDAGHDQARATVERMGESGAVACTSDYVVDETATLLKARGLGHLNRGFFEMIERAEALTLCHVDSERFKEASRYFLRHADHAYSFTDCTSFILMRELGVRKALTKDAHFAEAGFEVVLA